MIGIIVITHGQFGQELLRTAQDIAGRQDHVAALAVTSDMGLPQVSEALTQTIARLQASDGVLILVDMLGGTPCNTSLLKTKDISAEIITGVNLYMVLSSFTHRGEMALAALAAKAAEDGRRAIVLAKDLLKKKDGLMTVELLRIDDRLVHGQVVEGWVKALRIAHIVVASDEVEADETQKALFVLAAPHGVKITTATVGDAARAWKADVWKKERTLMLVSTPEDAVALADAGAPLQSVNLGGLHFRTGRVQVLKGISLDDLDVRALKTLASRGVLLEARPLPLDEPVDIALYLERWQEERESLGEQPR